MAQGARRPVKEIVKGFVEAPDAAEACRQRDFRHRHGGFVNELLGEEDAPRLCDHDRRSAQMLQEQSPQMALANAKTFGKSFDAGVFAVERAIANQTQCARNRVGGAAPGSEVRRGFRAATQARTKTRFLRGRGRSKEPSVFTLGGAGRTDWSAIDSSRCHAHEQQTVETRIAAL